jgi:hypothetical protein
MEHDRSRAAAWYGFTVKDKEGETVWLVGEPLSIISEDNRQHGRGLAGGL